MNNINHLFNKKRFFFIIFIIFIIFLTTKVNSYLIFPVDYLPTKNYKFIKNGYNLDTKEKSEFMQQLFFKHLITKFEIGTPAKSQMLIINTDSNQYYLDTLTPPQKIQEKCKISDFLQFEDKEFFAEGSSSSYNEEKCEPMIHEYKESDEICYSKEKIKFNIDGKSEIKEFPIKLIKNHDETKPGIIGLNFNNSLSYSERSFLSELKKENLVKDYYWFFDFEKISPLEQNIKGNLIIGDLPHNIYPEKYPEDSYIKTNSNRNSAFWSIKMDKIYIENKTEEFNLDNNDVALFYEFYPSIGSREFYNKIRENFMDKLVEEKKCFTGTFSQNIYSYEDILFYYCNKSAKNILYENLPNINFESKKFKKIFQLTKEELFYTKGNYIYFMVLFFPKQFYGWALGQIFTLKYNFVFHTDNNLIVFYDTVNAPQESIIDFKKKSHVWTFIIITSLAFLFIGIIIGIIIGVKFCAKNKRGKKAAELMDDDYEYNPKKDNIN